MNTLEIQDLPNIIERARNGDRDAFSTLYTAYFTPVYRFIYLRIRNRSDAEDLVQEVFLKAFTSFGRYEYRGVTPLAYFYTIARNTTTDFFRRKKGVTTSSEYEDVALEAIDYGDTPEDKVSRRQLAEDLGQKISILPEEQQEVVILRFVNDLSTGEIAELLNKTEEAVRQLQSRGLRSLRKLLTP